MDANEPSASSGVRVTFEDRSFSADEAALHTEWRRPTEYELSILNLLLSADIPDRSALELEARDCRVRQMDECGCIEFRPGVESAGGAQIVSEAVGPTDERGVALEVMLTLRGGHLLWLEFHRYGGDASFRPAADLFTLVPPLRT